MAEKIQPTKDDPGLEKLAVGCKKLAVDLLRVLERLKLKYGKSGWGSFKQALKAVLKENDIRELETRMERFQRQLGQRLLHTLR